LNTDVAGAFQTALPCGIFIGVGLGAMAVRECSGRDLWCGFAILQPHDEYGQMVQPYAFCIYGVNRSDACVSRDLVAQASIDQKLTCYENKHHE
jgi:hypothetical protein